MPLLPSTQTRTANNVPLYVPLDGEGNVPGSLTVSGPIVANLGGGSRVILEQGVDGPSVAFINPNSTPTLAGLTYNDAGALVVGATDVLVSMLGSLVTVGGITAPSVNTQTLVLPVTHPVDYPDVGFLTIGSYGFLWGNVNTTGSGSVDITLPGGRIGTLVGGSASAQLDKSGGNNFIATIGRPDPPSSPNGINIGVAYYTDGLLVPGPAGVWFIGVFAMSN